MYSNVFHDNDNKKRLDRQSFEIRGPNDDIIKILYQLLLHHDYESTARCLIKEALKMSLTSSDYLDVDYIKSEVLVDPCEQLLSNFKAGNWKAFFKLWDTLILEDVKKSREYKILTLNLYVHFAVLPKRTLLLYQSKQKMNMNTSLLSPVQGREIENIIPELEKSIKDGMGRLQEYLTTVGKELEHETDLRPFFALPFIEDPLAEPFLAKIFDKSWVDELTKNLSIFLAKQKQNLCTKIYNKKPMRKLRPTVVPLSTMPLENVQSNIIEQITARTNMPIVPNDRNIPVFLEDSDIDEQYNFHQKINSGMQSKGTQTHITGMYALATNIQEYKIYQKESLDTVDLNKNDTRSFQYNQELALTKLHLYNIHSNYEKLKLRFHKLHTDYHKLIGVAGELTSALENSVRGENINLQATLETCIKIFPDLFSQNVRDTLQHASMSYFDQLDIKSLKAKQSTLNVAPISPKLLDFKKIKLHLINGSVKTKLLLLQALRWKITLTQPEERDETIHEYINSDLLGLHGQIASDDGKSILPYLLISAVVPVSQPLQQSTARLLNTLASFRYGRDYLSVGCTVINVVFKCLTDNHNDGIDDFTCDMLIAMLQKLSLRKQQRIYMIEIGLVEWLICHLHNESCGMGFYRLEYATALLMNLSLHREARTRVSTIASLVISTFLTLLSIDHMPALPYTNGALNNFLSNHIINDEAKKMKLSSVLEYYCKQKTGEIKKHFDHILKIHKRENTNSTEGDETTDDDNEELDVLESQLEENDPVKNHTGELFGEELLTMCYTISSNTSHKSSTIMGEPLSKPIKLHATFMQMDKHQRDSAFYNIHHYPLTSDENFLPRKHNKKKINRIKQSTQIISPNKSYFNLCLFSTKSSLMFLKEQIRLYLSGNKETFASPINSEISSSIIHDTEINYRDVIYSNAPCNLRSKSNFKQSLIFLTNHNSSLTRSDKLTDGKKCTINAPLKEFEKRFGTQISNGKKLKNRTLTSVIQKGSQVFKLNLEEKANRDHIAVYYENQTSKDSSKTMVSSTTLASACESAPTEVEKLSSIASLCLNNDNKHANDHNWKKNLECTKEEEEAFLAKPKISRTPP